MSSTYTTNLNLRKPEHADPETFDSWDAVENDNKDKIDVAFGPRSYSEQNYISNSDSHSLSLNKLDMKEKDINDLTPTSDQKAALVGYDEAPKSSNKYLTEKDVILSSSAIGLSREIMNPEYPGAVFTIGEAGGENTGALTSDMDIQNNFYYNHYKWVSEETDTLQLYDIIVQWRVPLTFVAFEGSGALRVDISSQENDDTNNKLDVFLSKDGSAPTSSVAGAYGTAATWMSAREGETEIVDFANSDAVLAALIAGDTLNIRIRLYSKNNKYIKVGAITLYGKW